MTVWEGPLSDEKAGGVPRKVALLFAVSFSPAPLSCQVCSTAVEAPPRPAMVVNVPAAELFSGGSRTPRPPGAAKSSSEPPVVTFMTAA